ncbi:MAG TPA: M28 family peptidase [Candidatus Hydrogenedentes bacterium]|nr:M28 family peptidase [Candidatus Hydrogenedentota bacterium]
MSEDSVQSDIEYLASELPHRAANTDEERAAAEYIQKRFSERTPDVEISDFYSIDSVYFLFGSYYVEFCVVALIASWFPRVALCYGAAVFLAYLAEFSGYRVFSRFLPHFETQNVTARFLAKRPKRLLVVSAYYDSPRETLLTTPRVLFHVHGLHQALLICMLIVLLSCATESVALFEDMPIRVDRTIRWSAAGLLLSAGLVLFYNATRGEKVRGANGNASGVAALLEIARRLAQSPIDDADIWLVATGSHETWMSGMRHFVASHREMLDRDTTLFLNIEHVGGGDGLRYVTSEGILTPLEAAPELRSAAEAAAAPYAAEPARLRGLPTDASVPLARGYKAMTLTTLNSHGLRTDWRRTTDTVFRTDPARVKQAVGFAEAIMRRLAAEDVSPQAHEL